MTPENIEKTQGLVPGVYAATCQFSAPITQDFLEPDRKYLCALSVGWNPTYENSTKTVEVFIIDLEESGEFYGQHIQVNFEAFLRAESLFSSFDALILAI